MDFSSFLDSEFLLSFKILDDIKLVAAKFNTNTS